MTEKTKFRALLGAKCPKCKIGDVFAYPAFSLKYFKTHKNCPHCGLQYEREPSFFTGAMYISYFMNVGLVVSVLVFIRVFLNDPELWVYFAIFIPIYLPFIPLVFRYSRMILLYVVGDLR